MGNTFNHSKFRLILFIKRVYIIAEFNMIFVVNKVQYMEVALTENEP